MKYNNKVYSLFLLENLNESILHNFLKEKIKGINVTVPHKINIMKYLYKIDEQAKIIGSVNTLKYTQNGYIGYNTDINGIEDTLIENNINIKNKTVLLLGAGGSGYTTAFICIKNNVKKLIIANRTIENANRLKENILKYYKYANIEVVSLYKLNNIKPNIIINTTTLGFGENIGKTPLNQDFFKNNSKVELVYDIIYTPSKTELLKIAQNNNIKYINGFSMLVYQALKAEEIWLNKKINLNDKVLFKNKIYKEICKY